MPRSQGARSNDKKLGAEPPDHAISRSRGGLRTKSHLVCDGKGKGYPSKANPAWLHEHDIAATIPERDDQIAHRKKKPGRPIDSGTEQKQRYKDRNIVEHSFNKLKQWRSITTRSDKTARNHHTALCLATTLQWVQQHALRPSAETTPGAGLARDIQKWISRCSSSAQ